MYNSAISSISGGASLSPNRSRERRCAVFHDLRSRPLTSLSFIGLIGFELADGREAGRRLIDALQLFYHVANIGDARSLAIHPATTTHSQLSLEEQLATGVSDGYVRLSVGIEHIDDIIADLEQALAAAGALAAAA